MVVIISSIVMSKKDKKDRYLIMSMSKKDKKDKSRARKRRKIKTSAGIRLPFLELGADRGRHGEVEPSKI